ncbi:NADP-dependent oxidoreductase domain-containing protein [Epithele typhae]|uniref:NADP-dependent oxidoreductase domain-containing protein n=1 Tax=Epithele typhae TaxID=378194 RepID=UPI0020074ED6|nr:NADP-dependent oxidoreductase domain-containing protein [Epithele typhae]KAH9925633.1 NADP-dependent oxidoreductase domain-containing protein [Epithele typhae]
MSTTQKSALNVVMGAMTFGKEGMDGVRISNVDDITAILDVFRAHGHTDVDTSRMYGLGTSEEWLAKADWKSRGLKIHSKIYPIPFVPPSIPYLKVIKHTPEDLRLNLDLSLKALDTDSLDIFYLHGPDRTTPYEVTLKVVDELYKEGKFKRFGISNYMSWEVAEMVGICKANGYIQPMVYQGIYNAIHRRVEPELFPCLRKFGISFYEFNPLGGGFFTGRYRSMEDNVEPGSRFDNSKGYQGPAYRARYWNEPYFAALAKIEAAAQKHGLTLAEVALRWVSHHSLMKRERGDAILIGASSLKHIEQNLVDLEKGPLPEDVVAVLDEAWKGVEPYAAKKPLHPPQVRWVNLFLRRCTIRHTPQEGTENNQLMLLHRQTLNRLEYSWGLPHNSFDINDTNNSIILQATLRASFDIYDSQSAGWFLLPATRKLRTALLRHSPADGDINKYQCYEGTTEFEYQVMAFQSMRDSTSFVRYTGDPSSGFFQPEDIKPFSYPFIDFGPIHLPIPYHYVIANSGAKYWHLFQGAIFSP